VFDKNQKEVEILNEQFEYEIHKTVDTNPFAVYILNEEGINKANELQEAFSFLLSFVTNMNRPKAPFAVSIQDPAGEGYPAINTEEMRQFILRLQEASFHAKRAMAMLPENQK